MPANILTITQIIVSVLIIAAVLLQQRGTALGSAFGGGSDGGFYTARRGMQQKLYWITIILGVLFVVLAILNLFTS